MDNPMSLSETAIKILQILQNNPKASQSELANKAGMSRSSYWRHIKDMEESGIILNRNIEFDGHKIGKIKRLHRTPETDELESIEVKHGLTHSKILSNKEE